MTIFAGDEGLSDEEIDRIRRHADAVAHVIVEMFFAQRRAGAAVSQVPITLPHTANGSELRPMMAP